MVRKNKKSKSLDMLFPLIEDHEIVEQNDAEREELNRSILSQEFVNEPLKLD